MTDYIDRLDPSEQIDTEEAIASLLFNYNYAQDFRPNEEECTQLGRQILALVLDKFRPDLTEPPAEFEYRQTIIDTYPETDVQIPCLIRSSTNNQRHCFASRRLRTEYERLLGILRRTLTNPRLGRKVPQKWRRSRCHRANYNNYERFRRDIDEFYAESEY